MMAFYQSKITICNLHFSMSAYTASHMKDSEDTDDFHKFWKRGSVFTTSRTKLHHLRHCTCIQDSTNE